MAIDAGIYSQFAPAAKSARDFQDDDIRRNAALQGVESNKLALMSKRQQMDNERRAAEEQGQIRNALMSLGPQATDEQRIAALKGTGLAAGFTQADALQTGMLNRGKIEAETRGKQAESLTKLLEAQGTLATRVIANPTRETAAAAVANMKALAQSFGIPLDFAGDDAAIAQFQSPDQIKAWASGHALKAKELLPQIQQFSVGNAQVTQSVDPVTGRPTETGRLAIERSPDNVAQVEATIRGQNLVNARAREQAADARAQAAGAVTYQTDGDGNLVALPSRAVAGTVIRAQPVVGSNGMKPIPGKDGGLTEGQSKALSFGARMQQNRAVIDELEKGGTFNRGAIKGVAETIGRVAGLGTDTFGGTLAEVGGTATNWTQSEAQQRYETAKRNWIAANLRKESGAVIGTDEYRQADSQYFPQPGDDAKTKADKARLRATAEKTMLEEVPRGKRPTAGAAPSAAPATPAGGVVDWGSLK